jgi:myo-inositol-1(or 4)-monophosphatase
MNPEDKKDQLLALTREVKDYIFKEAGEFSKDKIEKKGKNDLVSYVDKTAEKMIVEGCRDILPEAGFIAEEGTSNVKGEQYNWIIDPLDGTTNFTHSLPIFSISIALAEGKDILLGVVHEVNLDECFYAVKGKGAYLNDSPITVSKENDLSESLLATGFPYQAFDKMDDYLMIMKYFMQNTHGLRRLGSAAVDLAYVACGRFEGFFEYSLKPWDIAAGALLVQEAGGKVTDFSNGDDYLFRGDILAANGVHQDMQKLISKSW